MKTSLTFKANKLWPILLLAMMLATMNLFMMSCSKQTSSSAYIMVVNGSQSSAAQDFYIDGTKLNTTALAFGQSTGYLQITANNSHLAAFKNSLTDTVEASTGIAPTPGNRYSAYFGDLNTINIFQNQLITPQSGNARLRFINLSGALQTSVDFAGLSGDSTLVFAPSAQYALASPYSQISILSNKFILVATGTSAVLLTMPVTLQAGKIYSIVISGASTTALTYSLIAEN